MLPFTSDWRQLSTIANKVSLQTEENCQHFRQLSTMLIVNNWQQSFSSGWRKLSTMSMVNNYVFLFKLKTKGGTDRFLWDMKNLQKTTKNYILQTLETIMILNHRHDDFNDFDPQVIFTFSQMYFVFMNSRVSFIGPDPKSSSQPPFITGLNRTILTALYLYSSILTLGFEFGHK